MNLEIIRIVESLVKQHGDVQLAATIDRVLGQWGRVRKAKERVIQVHEKYKLEISEADAELRQAVFDCGHSVVDSSSSREVCLVCGESMR